MFNGINNMNNPMNKMNGMNGMNMNNPVTFMQQFRNFQRNFQGDPKQTVLNMLNNGQMSQQQFNQLQNMANQIMNGMGQNS